MINVGGNSGRRGYLGGHTQTWLLADSYKVEILRKKEISGNTGFNSLVPE
jgi:hypothetical protein